MTTPVFLFAGLILVVVLVWLGLRRLWRLAEAANGADWGGKWINRIDGLIRLLLRHYHRFQCQPVPLPEAGPALVVANHVSGLDSLMMIAACNRPVRFIIAIEEYNRFGLRWLFRLGGCIPVDRKSRDDTAFQAALDALKRGEVVGLFPQGGIHDPKDPPPRLRRGVARLASLSGAPVYPVYISGIRAEGHVIRSVILRSHARLESFPPIECHLQEESECLQALAKILNKSWN